jgi:prophage tail gpP-like protein
MATAPSVAAPSGASSATAAAPDEISLVVANSVFRGWTSIEVTRSVERVPNSFTVAATTRDPANAKSTPIKAGADCQVKLGDDLVLTGYVDRVVDQGGPSSHTLKITGRGKCQDLVDCSAEWPVGSLIEGSALQIATKLASPYKINVTMAKGAVPGKNAPGVLLNYGETPMEIIERVTRAAQLLAYEQPNGDLLLDQIATLRAASGVAYGANLQEWSVTEAMDQRYSDVVCELLALDTLGDIGDGSLQIAASKDPQVPRHRLLYLVAEAVAGYENLAAARVQWEVARRAGRGLQLMAVVDSWRDTAGVLWTPNTLVPVSGIPGLSGITELAIADVTYRRDDDDGTTAQLLLMPPKAFSPEPIVLQPASLPDLTQ